MAGSSAARLEEILARALAAPDPAAALCRAARDRKLPAPMRRALAACDADGVRLTALLIAKLRFERLLRASDEAEWLFARDPAAFSELFQRYHRAVPPTAFFPAAEAELFRRFLSAVALR
jgi:hypothetical protein